MAITFSVRYRFPCEIRDTLATAGEARGAGFRRRAVADGDLARDSDASILVQIVNFGLTVQSSTGGSSKELLPFCRNCFEGRPEMKSCRQFERQDRPKY